MTDEIKPCGVAACPKPATWIGHGTFHRIYACDEHRAGFSAFLARSGYRVRPTWAPIPATP